MDLFISELLSAIIQLIMFAAIPFVWWIFSAKKKQNFFDWLGLKSIDKINRKSTFVFGIVTILLFIGLSFYILNLLKNIDTATSIFNGLGMKALPAVAIYAFIKTSLSEEIFFRGFILKRLSNKFGFFIANTIQSVLFGLLHGIMFINLVNPIIAIIIILFTGTIAYLMGYINEKKANGSIVTSWIIHALSNVFSSVIALFSII